MLLLANLETCELSTLHCSAFATGHNAVTAISNTLLVWKKAHLEIDKMPAQGIGVVGKCDPGVTFSHNTYSIYRVWLRLWQPQAAITSATLYKKTYELP